LNASVKLIYTNNAVFQLKCLTFWVYPTSLAYTTSNNLKLSYDCYNMTTNIEKFHTK